MVFEIQEPHVAPETRVEFLRVEDRAPAARGIRAAARPVIRDVRDALFLVDDQVVDDVEVFCVGLRQQRLRRAPVVAAVVHVHVQVGGEEPAVLGREFVVLQRHRQVDLFTRLELAFDVNRRAAEAVLDVNHRPARGHLDAAGKGFRRAMEIAHLARELRAVVEFVAVHPGVARRVPSSIAAEHGNTGGNPVAGGVARLDQQEHGNAKASGYQRPHGLARAAEGVLHPQRGIAALVADIRDALAVRRPASAPAVELAVGQRQRCGIIGRRQPELVPLAAGVVREQDPPAVRADLGTRGPGRLELVPVEAGDRAVRDADRADLAGSPGDFRVGDIPDAFAVRRP